MRAEKEQLRKDILTLLEKSSGAFLVAYKGLKVIHFREFRKLLAEVGSECHVVPNRIFRRAATEFGMADLGSLKFTGETALITGGHDPVRVAKLVKDFARDNAAMVARYGVLNRKLISAAEVNALAELPPREYLLAQLLGLLQAPARQLVTVLNAKAASIVYVLQAYTDKKKASA